MCATRSSRCTTGLWPTCPGAKVGSSSLRRRAQLKVRRPDLEVVEFRGNVQTRMKKLGDGVADATFLAMAGLKRLGMTDVVKSAIAPEDVLPAVAQGAIGIERRIADMRAAAMLEAIHHGPTGQRLAAERAFLAGLDGSCETPIAGLAELDGGTLRLRGEILRPDGSEVLTDDRTGPGGEDAREGLGQDGWHETSARARARSRFLRLDRRPEAPQHGALQGHDREAKTQVKARFLIREFARPAATICPNHAACAALSGSNRHSVQDMAPWHHSVARQGSGVAAPTGVAMPKQQAPSHRGAQISFSCISTRPAFPGF
jgi:hypothetical protein